MRGVGRGAARGGHGREERWERWELKNRWDEKRATRTMTTCRETGIRLIRVQSPALVWLRAAWPRFHFLLRAQWSCSHFLSEHRSPLLVCFKCSGPALSSGSAFSVVVRPSGPQAKRHRGAVRVAWTDQAEPSEPQQSSRTFGCRAASPTAVGARTRDAFAGAGTARHDPAPQAARPSRESAAALRRRPRGCAPLAAHDA